MAPFIGLLGAGSIALVLEMRAVPGWWNVVDDGGRWWTMWKVVAGGGIGISVLLRVYKAPYRSNTPLGPSVEELRPYGYIWIWAYGGLPRGLPLSQVATMRAWP